MPDISDSRTDTFEYHQSGVSHSVRNLVSTAKVALSAGVDEQRGRRWSSFRLPGATEDLSMYREPQRTRTRGTFSETSDVGPVTSVVRV